MSTQTEKRTVLLGTMEVAGYTWTATGSSVAAIRETMRNEWLNRVKRGDIVNVVRGEDPLEYHGLNINELTEGEVAWL